MKNFLKKTTSVLLALVSCLLMLSTAFATESEPPTENVTLVEAKIVSIPLKNRIVIGQSPKSPESIKIQLTYSDGTVVTDKVVSCEDGYFVNGELVEEAGGPEMMIYGITYAGHYMNEGKIFLYYNYLALPTLSNFFYGLFN